MLFGFSLDDRWCVDERGSRTGDSDERSKPLTRLLRFFFGWRERKEGRKGTHAERPSPESNYHHPDHPVNVWLYSQRGGGLSETGEGRGGGDVKGAEGVFRQHHSIITNQ